VHIVDVTAAAVRAAGLTRVALLGTRFTMEQSFVRERLAAGGVEALVPSGEDLETVHRVIYEELVHGVVREASRAAYVRVIGRLVAAGAEGVVLGCTEIELLVRPEDVDVPVFATTRLHALAAVDLALG
jgi:aspartate racemase